MEFKKDTKMPVVVGDIGGTNARLSIVRMSNKFGDSVEIVKTEVLVSKNFDTIVDLLKSFLNGLEGTEDYPVLGVIGICGPIFKNKMSIVANIDWPETTGEEVAAALNFKRFEFLNDFVTNGYGILSKITEGVDFKRLDNNPIDDSGPIAMIGAGTGLGHGYLTKHENGKYYHVFASEGGHQDFAPQNELQWKYHEYLKNFYKIKHVSVERACAGPAVPVMLKFLIETENLKSNYFNSTELIDNSTSEEIIKIGLEKTCQVCTKVIEFFVQIYAAAAGNMSLLLLPTGGIYLLGGISVALEEYMIKEEVFRDVFKNKGRLEPLLSKIPVFVVTNSFIGLKGAEEYARRLLEKLDKKNTKERLAKLNI